MRYGISVAVDEATTQSFFIPERTERTKRTMYYSTINSRIVRTNLLTIVYVHHAFNHSYKSIDQSINQEDRKRELKTRDVYTGIYQVPGPWY